MSKVRNILKQDNPNQPLSSQAIKELRYAFYDVLVELFAYYKDLVSRDSDGDMIFDTKRFFQFSKKQYREFYQQFFFAGSEKIESRLTNGLF